MSFTIVVSQSRRILSSESTGVLPFDKSDDIFSNDTAKSYDVPDGVSCFPVWCRSTIPTSL